MNCLVEVLTKYVVYTPSFTSDFGFRISHESNRTYSRISYFARLNFRNPRIDATGKIDTTATLCFFELLSKFRF